LINFSLCAKLWDLQVIEKLDHSRSHQQWVLANDRVIEYAKQAGFFIHSQLRWVRLNYPLLMALIERDGGPRYPHFISE